MFLQIIASCREQRCVFWITSSVSVIRVVCSSNGKWDVGQSVDGLFAAIAGRQFRRSRCIICRMWLFAKCLTWAGCGKAVYLCARLKVGCVNNLCLVGDVRHCYGAQRVGSAHVTHIRITLSSSTLQAHSAVGISVVGLGHNYSSRRHLLCPVQAVRRAATRVAHPS